MAKVKYPNPKFFKAKDNIEWKKQGENLKEVLGIFGGMLKETDWKQFGQDTLNVFKADAERIKGEYKDFMALSGEEKMDRCSTASAASAASTARARWRRSAASGAASRTPPMTSMSGPTCGACCS